MTMSSSRLLRSRMSSTLSITMLSRLRRHLFLPADRPAMLLLLLMLIEADTLGATDMDMDILRSALSMYACTNPADVMMGGSS